MNKIACLLNSPELGGAERSFVTQISLLQDGPQFDLYYPEIGSLQASKELEDFVKRKTNLKLLSFDYLEGLYRKSRSNKADLILSFFTLIYQAFLFKIEGFFDYKTIWCNGNKVFYPMAIGALIFRYKGVLLWHLRDYPAQGKINGIISKLVAKFGSFELSLVANSNSVALAYKEDFGVYKIHRVYNPVEDVKDLGVKEPLGVIGFAGMSAPWKGLHELYLWASLYEKELKEMGVKEIAVFGKNIYHTKGDHQNYEEEIKKLGKKFPSNLIVKKGLIPPSEIFSSIDLMLHLSVKEEPFGRVLLESFAYGVPCISTGLGGAGELMENFPELIHFPYDYGGLTKKLSIILRDPATLEEIRIKGRNEYKSFQAEAKSDLKILDDTYFQ